jgi:Gas vesicle synthesis protein GvpO
MADPPRRRSSSQGEKRQRPGRPARAQSAQRKQAASTRGPRSERRRARRPDDDPSLASAEEQDEETRSQADDVTDDEVDGTEEGGDESAADQDDAPDQEGSPEPGRRARRRQGQGSGVVRLVALARQQLEEVTGRPVSSVLGFEPQEDGWQLTLEVVELERIPDTTSILGCYRASLDRDGQLLEYRRLRRYNRSQPDEDY